MKILFITPGFGLWPNDGWGACENLTYELSNELRNLGHTIFIYHSQNSYGLRNMILENSPDVVHCEYDDYVHWLFPLKNEFQNIEFRFTTHYAYLTNEKLREGYNPIFKDAIQATKKGIKLFCLSIEISNVYIANGADPLNIRIFHNGANKNIRFADISLLNKAVCIAKVEYRKGQQYLTNIPEVHIVGPIHDKCINLTSYKGHWKRNELFENLTNYSCLVLLSGGEAHPLVICEAMMAGLSLVISRVASANLDIKPWIYIIEESDFTNTEKLQTIISQTIANNYQYRCEIRNYALEKFAWDSIALKY
jgi:hypothetical protein